MEEHREDIDEDERLPETRHRDAAEREDGDGNVQSATGPERGDDGRRKPNRHTDEQAGETDIEADGQPPEQYFRHRLVRAGGGAEVAMRDATEPFAVLHIDRLVEPEIVPERLIGRLIAGVLPKDGDGGIAGEDVEEAERDHAGDQQNRDHARHTTDDVFTHVDPSTVIRTAWTSSCVR